MFIREDSAVSIRHISWPHNSDHFVVVGEQHRVAQVHRMKKDIQDHPGYRPPSVVLVEDNDNSHDRHAVAVTYPFEKKLSAGGAPGVEVGVVGYLPRDDARLFRNAMAQINFAGRPLEVCGCVVASRDSTCDNVRIYLPKSFASYVAKGYVDDPQNAPAWLMDESPIEAKRNSNDYTATEIRQLYCRYAQVKAWNSLPYMVEEKAASWQHGIGPVGLAIFHHRTGVDKQSEEGQEELAKRAHQICEESLKRAYDGFDDLSQEDIATLLKDAFAAASDAASPSHAADELVMLEQLKLAESKKVRGLATAWRKLCAEARVRIRVDANRERFMAYAEEKALFMFQVLLSDMISDAFNRADNKTSLAAKRSTLTAAIDKVFTQAEALEISGAAEELERFRAYVQSRIDRLEEPGS